MILQNTPELWVDMLPEKHGEAHKYGYGHAVIYGAPELTGATRLAAEACARVGAGLVTVLTSDYAAQIYRSCLPAHIMVRTDLKYQVDNINARLFGPGGLPCRVIEEKEMPVVLDAAALAQLPKKLGSNYVLTPHEGEFAKAFPDLKGDRIMRANKAAEQTGAIVVLKGEETLIASPDHQVVCNLHASPYLATAGSGDVLSGMITGLVAQGMAPYPAACAAVWMHGECSGRFGPGLVAADLIDQIPKVLRILLGFS